MAISQRKCSNHPDRMAIGVCVITGKAICAECSTRYEGVNNSKEGLLILQQRRAQAGRQDVKRSKTWKVAALVSVPVLLYLLYLGYFVSLTALLNLRLSRMN